jgi:hypothetical protein
MGMGFFLPGVKRSMCDSDLSLGVKVKNAWFYTALCQKSMWFFLIYLPELLTINCKN